MPRKDRAPAKQKTNKQKHTNGKKSTQALTTLQQQHPSLRHQQKYFFTSFRVLPRHLSVLSVIFAIFPSFFCLGFMFYTMHAQICTKIRTIRLKNQEKREKENFGSRCSVCTLGVLRSAPTLFLRFELFVERAQPRSVLPHFYLALITHKPLLKRPQLPR